MGYNEQFWIGRELLDPGTPRSGNSCSIPHGLDTGTDWNMTGQGVILVFFFLSIAIMAALELPQAVEGPPPARRNDGSVNDAWRMHGASGFVNYGTNFLSLAILSNF